MPFTLPADYDDQGGTTIPDKLLSLRSILEPHGFYFEATGPSKRTVYIMRNGRKFGYYNYTVATDKAVMGYHSGFNPTPSGQTQNGIKTGTEDEFKKWFCKKFNCDETVVVFHVAGGTMTGASHPEILDLAVTLRVLLLDAGIETESEIEGTTQEPIAANRNAEYIKRSTERAATEEIEVAIRTVTDGQSLLLDSKLRKAIENHAMNAAREHFTSEGFDVKDHSIGHPYDLHCSRNGEIVLVEVKGTKSAGESIFLTSGEINCSRNQKMILFILHSIKVDDDRSLSGGESRIIDPWIPDDDHLKPLMYKYAFPPVLNSRPLAPQ